MIKEIPLTQDKVTLVDDEDYEYLMQWKWFVVQQGKTHYACRTINYYKETGERRSRRIWMHRVIAEKADMDISNYIDHIDRDGLNNQRSNIRPATCKQNNENRGLLKNNKSGHNGIHWDSRANQWRARICHNNKRISLGHFKKLEDAVKAREEAEKLYYSHSEVCI